MPIYEMRKEDSGIWVSTGNLEADVEMYSAMRKREGNRRLGTVNSGRRNFLKFLSVLPFLATDLGGLCNSIAEAANVTIFDQPPEKEEYAHLNNVRFIRLSPGTTIDKPVLDEKGPLVWDRHQICNVYVQDLFGTPFYLPVTLKGMAEGFKELNSGKVEKIGGVYKDWGIPTLRQLMGPTFIDFMDEVMKIPKLGFPRTYARVYGYLFDGWFEPYNPRASYERNCKQAEIKPIEQRKVSKDIKRCLEWYELYQNQSPRLVDPANSPPALVRPNQFTWHDTRGPYITKTLAPIRPNYAVVDIYTGKTGTVFFNKKDQQKVIVWPVRQMSSTELRWLRKKYSLEPIVPYKLERFEQIRQIGPLIRMYMADRWDEVLRQRTETDMNVIGQEYNFLPTSKLTEGKF
ncbi:MAG: hypothetical protein ABIC04_02180 [Nanoarchaeota archaeon]